MGQEFESGLAEWSGWRSLMRLLSRHQPELRLCEGLSGLKDGLPWWIFHVAGKFAVAIGRRSLFLLMAASFKAMWILLQYVN